MDLLPISPASGLQTKIRPSPLFSDRDQLVSYFRENILEPPENPAHNIIAIWGQDGLGKSTLLSRFVYEARTLPAREYCFSALVNYRHTSPLIIMGEFAEQLRRQGHPLPLFERELLVSTNQEHTHPTKKSQEARTIGWFQRMLKSSRAFLGQISPLGRRLANLRIGAALALPEESLYRDIQGSGPPLQETLLTQTFVKDLNQLTRTLVRVRHDGSKRERRIILFFDAFEHMPPSTVSWFLNRLLAQMISDQVVLVLAGTNPIDHTIADDPRHWSNYIEALYPISLQPLTAEQTRDYLAEKGITEPEWVDWVWKDSQGIPIKVDILATQLNLIGEALTTTEQKLVLHAALFSRPFTQDDLAAFSFISPSVRAAHFQWLTSLPFAHKTLSGRYNYHKLARRQFGTYFHKNFREDYKQARQELASYYRGLLGKLFPEPASQELHTSPGWLELKLALAYQWFLVPERDDHVRALLQVLHAYESTHRREEIRQMLDEMLEDTDTMGLSEESLQFINQLQRYILADEPGKEKELLEATNDLLSTSIPFRSSPPSSQLLPGIIAGVYQKRGDAALLLQQYEQALADFERALRMNSKPNNQGYYLKSVAFQTFFSTSAISGEPLSNGQRG